MNPVLWSIPAGSAFPQHLHGREVVIIGATYAGAPDRGHEILRPLREFDEPILDLSATIPYCTLQQLFDPFIRKGELLHYWKAIYLDRLTDDAIEAIVSSCASRPSPRSLIDIWALGGAMARIGQEETPVGSRVAPFLLQIIGSWAEPAQTEQNVVWVHHVFETMHSFSSGKLNPELLRSRRGQRTVGSRGLWRSVPTSCERQEGVRPDKHVSAEPEHRCRSRVKDAKDIPRRQLESGFRAADEAR